MSSHGHLVNWNYSDEGQPTNSLNILPLAVKDVQEFNMHVNKEISNFVGAISGFHEPDGDDIYEEVQCEKCKNWSHIECLPLGVDWHAEDVRFICQLCGDEDPLDWMAPDVKWYPARFVQYNKRAAPQRKYEFEWFECTDSVAYHSDNSLMPPELLRKFARGRSFCEVIDNIDLTAEQLRKVRLPFYLRPDYPEHKNPELTAIFTAATTPITNILAGFDIIHPGVADFMRYFRGKKPAELRPGLNDWLVPVRVQLVPTPELEEVLAAPSMASPTNPVPVVLKRKAGAEAEVDGEKEPKRRNLKNGKDE
ncbi:hypothetical protein C8R45DRAFT_923238 [Mycena sanguinolenta]|nr:hypothetical protein C8R45DRAFT_923238 [Mycena sanguinolenta]